MSAIQKRAIKEVFAEHMFVHGCDGHYRVPEGWYPVLGLPGSLDIAEGAVLFCKLAAPMEARLRQSCFNGVIAKIRIHRSARVNGPDTMLVFASDLLREFAVCRVPILASVEELAAQLSGAVTTAVPPDKCAAYRKAHYRFGQGADAVNLRVDFRSNALARLYAASGFDCGAFITACNPLGVLQDQATNQAAHARLVTEMAAVAVRVIEGAGSDPAGEWPAEQSCFGLGVDLAAAKRLGASHRQDAIVWAGPDAVPRLVLLR